MKKWILVSALVMLAVLSVGAIAGCKKAATTTATNTTATTTTAATTNTTTATTTTTQAPAPTVKITSPAANANVPAGNVSITIDVANMRIVTPGGPLAAGEGHVHYYLDVPIPTTPNAPAVTAAGTYQVVAGTTATWNILAPGQHTLGVQLVQNNHTPFVPAVTAEVKVTVAAATTTTTTTTTTTATTTTTPATTTTTTTTTTTPGAAPRIPANHVGRTACAVCHSTPIPPAPRWPVPPRNPDHTAFTDAIAFCQACHQGP